MKKPNIVSLLFFVGIPIGMLILFTYLPFLNVIIDSFFSKTYTANYGFVGLDNYTFILTNPEYSNAFANSIYYIVAAFIQVALSLILAVFLCRVRFSTVFKVLIVLPYMISGMAIGYIFRLFYTHGYVLDSFLMHLGFELESLPYWLRDQSVNNWAIAFASVWRYTGISLVIFVGAIGSIHRSLFEASWLDGAGSFAQFRYIIWPSIRFVVIVELFLSVVTSLSEFELPHAIASGGANGTATYMTHIYRVAFTERKIGVASAMTVILLSTILLAIILITQAGKIWQRIQGAEEGVNA